MSKDSDAASVKSRDSFFFSVTSLYANAFAQKQTQIVISISILKVRMEYAHDSLIMHC